MYITSPNLRILENLIKEMRFPFLLELETQIRALSSRNEKQNKDTQLSLNAINRSWPFESSNFFSYIRTALRKIWLALY